MKWPVPLTLVMIGALAIAPRASAHALLRQADPENGTALQRPPQTVTLTFTEDPEPALSSIRVLTASGEQVSESPPRVVPGRPSTLQIALGTLSPGVYTVTWRTVSRVDGHVTGGAFAFGVGVTPTAASVPRVESAPPSVFGGASRWMLYVGLSLLIGTAWVWTLAFPRAADGSWRVLWLAWLAAALGVIALEEAQRADAGVDFAAFMRTSLGWTLEWRALPLVAAAGALVQGSILAGRGRRMALAVVGACALASILAHVEGGHAAAAAGAGRWANVVVQWLHFSAVGAWLGGLAALLVALGPIPDDDRIAAAQRFSIAAGVLLVVVAATGTARAVDEVGAWDRLVTTPFGQLVLLKVGLLILLATLGAFNRYRSVPAAIQSLTGLRRIGATELGVGVITLMVASVLTQTAPAVFRGQTPEAEARRLLVTGSDFGTSVRVRLEVAPGVPGSNRFSATLQDFDTDAPAPANQVSLRFTSVDRPDLGPSTLDLTRSAPGIFQGQGTNLSLEGKWNVVVLVERGVNSVEVPLTFVVRSHPQVVRTIAAPGQPTLYSVDLPGGYVLDAYLDPGHAGFNEIHATYISPAGTELPIPRLATMAVTRAGNVTTVPVRRFGPGHFIGDATLQPGIWELEVAVTTARGEVLRSDLTVRVGGQSGR